MITTSTIRGLARHGLARVVLVTAIGVAVVATSLTWGADATAENRDVTTSAVPPHRVIADDFPDPDVGRFGDVYFAYSTNSGANLPVATSSSPTGPWTRRAADALPQLGSWAQPGRTWAPDVSRRPDGTYLLYYTAHSVNPDRQCIGAATSNDPGGPFAPVGDRPLVCPAALGGAIDASTFSEGDDHFLIYKIDANAIGRAPEIFLQRTSPDGLTLIGDPVVILRNDRSEERGILEAPVLVRQGGHYVLFYAGGEYWNDSYFTSYATASSITGPYEKAYRPLMTGASLDGAVTGPGGADVLRGENGADHIVFHGHTDVGRSMYVAELGWAGDHPVVRGSRVRYEAERGTLNHCRVRDGAAGASQGAVAAYIDYGDSFVELRVFAAGSGAHTVSVAFANGSVDGAEHSLTVNGQDSGVVRYPRTGWDRWRQVDVDVTLNAGWNTIRLGHSSAYAELDYIEVR